MDTAESEIQEFSLPNQEISPKETLKFAAPESEYGLFC
jgi:hypothetical protein